MTFPALTLFVSVALATCGKASTPAASVEPMAQPSATRVLDTVRQPLSILPTDSAARVAFLTGRFDPSKDSNFVVLPADLTDGDGTYLLRRETATALAQLIAAAKKDGLRFRVASATRNFDRQAQIWGAKWRGERTLSNGVNLGKTIMPDSAKARMILLYSSMPGTSRHHWGTDFDLNVLEPAYWKKGQGAKEYAWLVANAASFGFFQPYTSKAGGRTGYEEEHWHWSYAPLSVPLLAAYRAEVGYGAITGFDGSAAAQQVRAIEEYVLGIGE